MAAEGRSPWLYALFYALLGCLGLVAVIGVVIGALTFVGVRTARNIAADNEDPERRGQRALEILGADEAPGGFHAVAVVSIPFVIDMAILSDVLPGEEPWTGEFGERGFYYVQALWGGDDLRAFFDGEASEAAALRDMGLEIDLKENIGRGDLDREDVAARWATFRGSTRFGPGEQIGELVTLIEFDCPQDERMRMGIWFGPVGETGGADETQDAHVADSVPGSETIAAFLEPIHPCGAAPADGG